MEQELNNILFDDETIQKALEILKVATDEGESIEKAMKPKAQMPKSEETTEPNMKKSDEEMEEGEETDEDDDELQKACDLKKAELAELEKKMAAKKGKKAEPKKEEEGKPSLPGLFDKKEETIKKADLADLFKGFIDELNEGSASRIESLLESMEEIKKSNQELQLQIDKLAGTPNERKSFTKANVIEKSVQSDISGKKVLSVARNKAEVLNTLVDLSGLNTGKMNDSYADAVSLFESAGAINKSILNDLYANHNIQIVQ